MAAISKETNIEVVRCSAHIWKDEKGYYIYISAKARPVTFAGIRAHITDPDDIKRLNSLYRKEEPK